MLIVGNHHLLADAGSFQHFVKGSEFRIFAPANRKIVTP